MSPFRLCLPSFIGICFAAAVWGPFGFRNDYVGFLLGMLFTPAMALCGVSLLIAMPIVRTKKIRLRLLAFGSAALVTASTVVGVWMEGKSINDPVRYAAWSVTHPQELARAKRHDGIFFHWDSWGMVVTGDFDTYLVSYRSQPFRNASTLRSWLLQRSKDCGMPFVDPIDTGIYVITTANCATLPNDFDVTKD